ncbi:metallophosphoesterase [Oceanobacillus manasiensis]|uniref:metallophosphoesterase n=1 Tax=Oceanobacillus manasiensis TaxID=586413 RepID=UPI0005A5D8D3|nr:metallophosphoesterase [Oceanobacillus manasiensis]
MTKVLIISDSHGLTDELLQVKNEHKLEYMIHCGDSELDMDTIEMDGFFKVAGNCDLDTRYPEEQTLEVNNVKFLAVHGHLHNVKQNLLTAGYRAEELGANVICFGHTHVAGAQQENDQLFINPGSIRQPRGRLEKTYAIMEWENPQEIEVTFYTLDGNEVKDLFYKASL